MVMALILAYIVGAIAATFTVYQHMIRGRRGPREPWDTTIDGLLALMLGLLWPALGIAWVIYRIYRKVKDRGTRSHNH